MGEQVTKKVKDSNTNNNLAIGLALGLTLGVVASVVASNWGLIGAGLCIGVVLGLGVDFGGKKKHTNSSKKEK